MGKGSRIYMPNRCLGYVSNHIPLQVRFIKVRKEYLITTCVGKSFHTYGISHFGLLSVSPLHHVDITAMASDTYHIYTSCDRQIYAWRRGCELQATYSGHKEDVHLLLPFGVHLISVDESSTLRVWDIKEQSLYLELTFNNKIFKITAILHPNTYINKALIGSQQGALQLWNINTSKLIYTFDGWGSSVTCLQQAPALDVVAIGLENGKILLHNLKFDETLMEFQQDWGLVTSISFRSDDQAIMATGSQLGHIVFWNLEEKRVASQLLDAHTDGVTGMVCIPGEPLLLTTSPDNTLKLWIFDMTDGGARLLRLREGHSSTPSHIRFHGSDGDNILSAASDSTLRIFNTKNEQFNKSLGRASYQRKKSKKRGLRFEDNLVMPPIVQFTAETVREKEWDNIAAIHADLAMVTTWSYDKLRMGELKLLPERLYKKSETLEKDKALSLCLTHCGNFILVGYSSGNVEKFNMQSGKWRGQYGKPAHKSPVRGVATDLINQIVITGGCDGFIKFWRFKISGDQPFTSLPLAEPINFFRAHRESSLIAAALEDFTVVIVDIETQRIVRQFDGHTAPITDATFSPDSRWLITAGMDCIIRTWNIPSAHLIDQFRTPTACISLDYSPTGAQLITAHVDYMGIFVWANRAIYQHVALKAIDFSETADLVELPQCSQLKQDIIDDFLDENDDSNDDFVTCEQIDEQLITLSGLATSRWQNLLNIDVIRSRNKPKEAPVKQQSAPFFLPTLQSLNNIEFDVNAMQSDDTTTNSKLLTTKTFTNLTDFGRLLLNTADYQVVVDRLKSIGPTMLDHELKSLGAYNGGSIEVMLQFFKCIEFMLKSNRNFELAQSYLSVFLKSHGDCIADEYVLRTYMVNIQSCLTTAWQRIQEKFMYNLCILQNIKNNV